VRIDDCVVPELLLKYQYVDYFGTPKHIDQMHTFLIAALKNRAQTLNILV
jgi:hypothetical protein